jgi:acetyl esterase/lipase
MVPGVIRAQLQRGWVVVSADYRLAPSATWPAQSHDVDRAVRWVRAAASSLGIDTERMYLSGHSAGAHLALLHGVAIDRFVDPGLPAALASVPASVAGVVALSAPSDLAALNFDVWGYTSDAVLAWLFACAGTCDPAVLAEASPVTFVSTDDPPVYIAHGADDAVVDVSHATGLYAAFEAVGLATQTMLDVVDSVQVGGRSRSLPDTSRGHDADTGVNLAALERFLDRTE